MIFLLEVDKTKRKSRLSRLFSRGMNINCIQAEGAVICKITVRSETSIDWLRISSMMGENDCIAIQKSINIPIDVHLNRPDGDSAMRRLLMRGIYQVVREAHSAGARLSILLIDRDAHFGEFAVTLAPICSQLSILSEQSEIYSAYAEKAFGEYGVSPIILNSAENAPECDIIIAPNGINGCGALPLPRLIFAPYGSDCVSVSEDCINLPIIYDGITTENYDAFALAAALDDCSEYSGSAATIKFMKWRDRISPVSELSGIFYT